MSTDSLPVCFLDFELKVGLVLRLVERLVPPVREALASRAVVEDEEATVVWSISTQAMFEVRSSDSRP